MGSAFTDKGVLGVTGSNGTTSNGGLLPNLSLTNRMTAVRTTDYTLQPGDVGSLQVMNSAGTQTFSPTNSLPAGWWCDLVSVQSPITIAGTVTSINGSGSANVNTIAFRTVRLTCTSPGNFVTTEMCGAYPGAVVLQSAAMQQGLLPGVPGSLLATSDTNAWGLLTGQNQVVFTGSPNSLAATHNRKMLFFSGTLFLTAQAAGFTCDIRNTGSSPSNIIPPSGYSLDGLAVGTDFYLSPGQSLRVATYDGNNYWLTNRNWAQTINGYAQLGSTVNVPYQSWAAVGCRFTLPCAGVYLITASICAYAAASGTGIQVLGALQDSTIGQYITPGLYIVYTTGGQQGVYGSTVFYGVTSSRQIDMMGYYSGSGTYAQILGGSFMWYTRMG